MFFLLETTERFWQNGSPEGCDDIYNLLKASGKMAILSNVMAFIIYRKIPEKLHGCDASSKLQRAQFVHAVGVFKGK